MVLKVIIKMILSALIFGVIIYGTLYFLPPEYYKKGISWLVKRQTGSELNIKGDIEFAPFEEKILVLHNVDFINHPDEHAKMTINFERITFFREGEEIKAIKLRNTQIIYKDTILKAEYKLHDLNSDIVLAAPGRPMTLNGDVVLRGQKVDYDVVIEDPEAIKDGRSSAITASASSDFLKLDYDGVHSEKQKRGTLNADISSIEQIMLWAWGEKKVSGNGKVTLDYSIKGSDVSSLNGTAKIEFHNLIQKYTDKGLDQMIRHLTGKTMKISDLNGTFNIRNGIIYSKDLSGTGPTQFQGKGTINLVDKTIDYRITPEVKITSVQSVPKLSPPISIKGSLMHPEITVEIQDVVKEVVKKPEQIIQTITDVTTNNEAGKQIKKDLQDLRDNLLKNPEMQKQLLDGLLGGFGKQPQPQ